MEHIKLAIKPGSSTSAGLCALCGKKTEPQRPFDLFLNDTQQLVCKSCGEKCAPELVSLLDYFYKGHYVEPEYETIESEVSSIKTIAQNMQTENLYMLEQDLFRISRQAYLLRKHVVKQIQKQEENTAAF
jgi:hypothetical protein